MDHLFYRAFLLMALALFSCESRFSKYAIHDATNRADHQEETAQYIEKSLEENPDHASVAVLKLKLLKSADWPEESFAFLKEVISKDSANATVLELAADFHLSQPNLDPALYYAGLAEKNGAQSAGFYQLKSRIYNEMGEYDRAIDYINKAILINRSDFKSYYDKGKIYLSFGDTISGLKFMRRGLAQYRNNHEVLYEVSDIYEKIGQHNEALNLIDEAISFAPDSEKLKIKKSKILLGQDKIAEAKQILSASFMEDSTRVGSGIELGNIHLDQSRYDSAIVMADKTLAVDSLLIGAWLLKARAYDGKGFLISSLNNYTQVLSIDSLHEDARNESEKVKRKRAYLQKLKEEQEAIPTFDFFLQKQ